MTDITFKDIPEGAEEHVKELAAVAVERFLRLSLKPSEEQEAQVRIDTDAFRKANAIPPKYPTPEE